MPAGLAHRRRTGPPLNYTVQVLIAVVGCVTVDLAVLRTKMLARRAFWASYAIVLGGQLVVNGLLTGLPVVRYDAAAITGYRLAYAPVEDIVFGFCLVLSTLSIWVWLGRRRAYPPTPDSEPTTP